MKYDFRITRIDINTAQGKILSQIKLGSIVLECGCATGYMTKFMKEELNAEVYIIEYEQPAFDKAIQYAKDGICTDLMQDEWLKKFKDFRFDYIIFADVLEHLYNPSAVLKKAVTLLKDDGTVLVSLPNIAHNDILLNLYHDNWSYTSLVF